jgi:hypothetical protein
MDNFRFRKEDLAELFELLRKPMETMLEFVTGTTDLVKVKNWYTVQYETGLLMIIYRLSRPHRVRSNMEVKFGHCQGFISGVCNTFINALYTIAHKYLTNPGLFHCWFPVYAEKIAAKMGYAAINVWGFIDGTLKKTCRPTYFQKAAYSGHKHCHGLKFQTARHPMVTLPICTGQSRVAGMIPTCFHAVSYCHNYTL